jgi:3-methylcrotonyl-CoA carboxylase beta subunit
MAVTSLSGHARRGPEHDLRSLTAEFVAQEAQLRLGGGPEAIERQHSKGRKTARERVEALLDLGSPSLELGLWAAFQMYEEWGGAVAAGVITLIGSVAGRRVMIVANDATVKAGACFPMTIKKILRPDGRRAEPPAAHLSRRLVGCLFAHARRGLS